MNIRRGFHLVILTALLVSLFVLQGGNSVSPVSAAVKDTALIFNGSSQYVTFGLASDLGAKAFTLETWFKKTGTGVTANTGSLGVIAVPLIAKGRHDADGSNVDMNYFLGIDGSGHLVADFEECKFGEPVGDNSCQSGGTPGLNHPVQGSSVINNNVWYHAAATYNGRTWFLYLNGVQDASLTVSASTDRLPRWDSIEHASLATTLDSKTTEAPEGYFAGVLDEVRIWNVARDQGQIQTDMNNELTSGTGLIARWGLNEGSGIVVGNSVSGGVNGTAVGSPTWLVPDTTPPAAPTGLAASPRSHDVDLSWSANSESDLAGYNVYRSTSSPVGLTGPINGGTLITSTRFTDGAVTNGTPYYYAITAVDTSSNESGGSNEVFTTPLAIQGSALQFSSGTDYVTFGNPSKLGLTQFTIETWFKRTGPGTSDTTGNLGIPNAIPLVTHGSPEADGSNVDANWILVIDNATGVIAADFEDMASGLNHPVLGITPISMNIWHHAAATYDGTTWRLYLDGNLETTLMVNQSPRSDSIQKVGLATMIQSDGTTTHGHFQGILDEVRVWNVARTQSQIAAGMDTELSSGTGLVARWGFGEGSGMTVGDSVATAADGTITGTGTTWVAGAPFVDPRCPSSSGIVGCWMMDEGAGNTLYDGTGQQNNAMITGSPTWIAGKYGGLALDLNGTSDYAVVPNSNSLESAITLAAWVKPEQLANQEVITKNDGTNGYALALASGGKVVFTVNATQLSSTAAYPTDGNTWIHIAGTYDGTNMKIYINGLDQGTFGKSDLIGTNQLDMGIGATAAGGNKFKGAIDDARIYSGALSGTQISALAGVPTAVELASFTGDAFSDGLALSWETASEMNLLGFNVYRSATLAGAKQPLNGTLIPALHFGQMLGDQYQFSDPVGPGKMYYYWLELVKTDGSSLQGPVALVSGYRLQLPLIIQ